VATDTTAEADKVRALRELLPAAGAGIYLDAATFGPLPAETAEAMRQAEDWELRVGRVTAGREEDVDQRADEARAVIAALIGAAPDAIALAYGRDDAIALARASLGRDATIVELVSSVTGERAAGQPAPARDAGPLVVDASNAAGAIPLAVDELTADAVVLATDRWLLGPEGTAALWLRRPSPVALPARQLPRTALVGLARSVGWLEMYVGLDWIHERTARLAGRLHGALSAIDGVEVVTPSPPPAGIVSFRLPAWPVQEVAEELGRRVFALLRALPAAGLLRASVGWYNTADELDRFAGAVAELTAHTPESLPRRPPLVIR
jgi:selenocysteine lyase/cysteine desulfurase